jgi:hypothetical protein
MQGEMLHRRAWIGRILSVTGWLASVFTAGCAGDSGSNTEVAKPETGQTPDCLDVSSVSDDDRKAREALGYEANATDPERRCSGCALYVPPKSGGCAGCMLFKGPILPEGSCIQFQPRPS